MLRFLITSSGKFYLPLFLFFLGIRFDGSAEDSHVDELKHTVQVIHPGLKVNEPMDCTLVQLLGKKLAPDQFYMDVDSVYCSEDECENVPVRVFWDELGFFKRINLEPGVELEKAEGEAFSDADYEKLHQILGDRNSALRDVDMETVVEYQKVNDSPDTVSGATAVLDKDQYVEGAVWTSYTMWHWVNGEINAIIRDKTGDASDLDELRRHLATNNHPYRIFALEQLLRRRAYDPQTLDQVIKQAPGSAYDSLKLIIGYVECADSSLYYSSVLKLLELGNQKERLIYLNSLLDYKEESPKGYFERLSRELPDFHSFQEVNLFLAILERKHISSPTINKQIIRLLDNEDILIARRAYWFLGELDLDASDQKKLEDFFMNHQDML